MAAVAPSPVAAAVSRRVVDNVVTLMGDAHRVAHHRADANRCCDLQMAALLMESFAPVYVVRRTP